jgi:ATP-binding protein involved in chromosome partitioning
MGKFSKWDVNQVLSNIVHPEINFSLVELGMIEDVACRENQVELTLKLPFPEVPIKELLIQNIKSALGELDAATQVKIDVQQMTQEERDKFMQMAKKGWKS